MAHCPQSGTCTFYQAIEPSIVKRIKFASAFPYCKGDKFAECALYSRVISGRDVPTDLLPDGSAGDYLDSPSEQAARVGGPVAGTAGSCFLVVDDSPVFAIIAANAIKQHISGAVVEVCATFGEAEAVIRSKGIKLVISGYGLGDGKTVLDVRRMTEAPILVFTGRPGEDRELPHRSRVVAKGAGPDALRGALDHLLAS
jgi:hypothetical protein